MRSLHDVLRHRGVGCLSLRMNYEYLLDTYSMEEILELNERTEEEALEFMVEQGFLSLPSILPVDVR